MKELTIIIPVYNAEKHVRRCLDSILPQLQETYELLLINDGSTDHSLGLIKEYEEKYPDVIRVIDKQNEGVALTRDLGVKEAQGKYICFVDNDDDVEEDYFETYLEAIRNTDYDIVIGGYQRTDDHHTKYEVRALESPWYKFTVPAPWAKIYRRSFLLENKIHFLNYKSGEDIYFNLVCFAKTSRIRCIPYSGYHWYDNQESVSNTVQKSFRKEIDITYLMDQFYCVGKKNDIYFQYFYVRYGIWYLLFSGRSGTKEHFMREYQKVMKWLKEKKIPLKFPLLSPKTKGERLSVKIALGGFIFISRMHLMKFFAAVFCRR